MLGAVGHLEDLAVCSQVGRTAWRKVRVCFSCLKGFIQYNTTPFQKHHFGNVRCLSANNISGNFPLSGMSNWDAKLCSSRKVDLRRKQGQRRALNFIGLT